MQVGLARVWPVALGSWRGFLLLGRRRGPEANVSRRRADSLLAKPAVCGQRALAPVPATGRSANVSRGLIVESPLLGMTKLRVFLRALGQNRACASRVS